MECLLRTTRLPCQSSRRQTKSSQHARHAVCESCRDNLTRQRQVFGRRRYDRLLPSRLQGSRRRVECPARGEIFLVVRVLRSLQESISRCFGDIHLIQKPSDDRETQTLILAPSHARRPERLFQKRLRHRRHILMREAHVGHSKTAASPGSPRRPRLRRPHQTHDARLSSR